MTIMLSNVEVIPKGAVHKDIHMGDGEPIEDIADKVGEAEEDICG